MKNQQNTIKSVQNQVVNYFILKLKAAHQFYSKNLVCFYAYFFQVPDLFFPNEKSAEYHDVTVQNQVVNIYPNGTVRYSSRYVVYMMSLYRTKLSTYILMEQSDTAQGMLST